MCATPSHSSEFGSSTHSELILSENNNISFQLLANSSQLNGRTKYFFVYFLDRTKLLKKDTHIWHFFFWKKKSDHCVIFGYVWRLTQRGERDTFQKCTKRFTSSIEMYSSLKLARKNIQTVELSFANCNWKPIRVAHISIPKSIYSEMHYYTWWCVS